MRSWYGRAARNKICEGVNEMAKRKKKNKIIVELDLPKDDSPLTKLYAILFVSMLLG